MSTPTPTPSPTPTSTPSLTASPTPTSTATGTPAVTPMPSASARAADLFGRQVANGWGNADVGGSYVVAGPSADYDVTGGVGRMRLPAAGAGRAGLLSVSAQNADLSARVATDKVATGSGQYLYLVARRVNSSTEYRAKLRFAPDGTVRLQATRVVANAESAIGTEVNVPGLAHTAGQYIRLRAQVTGTNPTTIRIKTWANGAPEPATWTVSATDTTSVLQTTGSVGLRTYLAASATNGPILMSFDDFQVWEM
jgi:hypothetical protein